MRSSSGSEFRWENWASIHRAESFPHLIGDCGARLNQGQSSKMCSKWLRAEDGLPQSKCPPWYSRLA